MNLKIAIVSAPSMDVAENIAQTVVSERLAACVNIISGVSSLYFWQGKLERSSEVLLLIKSVESQLSKLEARVLALHPYDTPEFVVVDAEYVNERYAAWVKESIGK